MQQEEEIPPWLEGWAEAMEAPRPAPWRQVVAQRVMREEMALEGLALVRDLRSAQSIAAQSEGTYLGEYLDKIIKLAKAGEYGELK